MSYILYSSIARAGGIDLLLGTESFAHEPSHPLRRRPKRRRLAALRRGSGRVLVALGGALIRWGRAWAPAAGGQGRRSLQLAAE